MDEIDAEFIKAFRRLFSNPLRTWCREGGSNPHDRKGRRILSPLRLPVPPSRLGLVSMESIAQDLARTAKGGGHGVRIRGGCRDLTWLRQRPECRQRHGFGVPEMKMRVNPYSP